MGDLLDRIKSDIGNFVAYLNGDPVIYDQRSRRWVRIDRNDGAPTAPSPTPARRDPSRIEERLREVMRLLEAGDISQQEAEESRARILKDL